MNRNAAGFDKLQYKMVTKRLVTAAMFGELGVALYLGARTFPSDLIQMVVL